MAKRELEGLGRVVQSSEFQAGAATIGASFVAMGTALGGALLFSAKNAANYGNALLDASQKTGISTETLAGYKLLADQSGTSLEQLSSGLDTLSKNMVTAATKGGEKAKFFDALGISVKDSAGNIRGLSEVVPQIADRISKMGDGALKSAVAAQFFGKAVGPDLIPFLQGGSAALDEAGDKAERYGLKMSEAEAVMSAKFNASLAETKAAMHGLSDSIGIVLLPKLTDLVNTANEWIATATQWTKKNPEIAEGLAGISLALVGGGGVLVGLASIATFLPTLTKGFELMGIKSVGALGGITLAITGIIAQMGAMVSFAGKLRDNPTKAADPRNMTASDWFSMISIPGALSAGYNFYQGAMNPRGPSFAGVKGGSSTSAGSMDEQMRQLLADLEKKSTADKAAADKKKKQLELDQEQKRFRQSVDALKLSLTDTVPPSQELVAAIKELDKAGMMTSEVMLALAKNTDTLKNSQDPLIQGLVKGIPFIQMASRSYEMLAENIRLVDEATKSRQFDPILLPVDMTMPGGPPLAAGDIRGNMIGRRADEARDSLTAQREEIQLLAGTIAELNRQNMSAKEIEQALGISLEDVAESARELGVEISPIVERLAQSEKLSRSWGESLGQISDELVDMIVDFDFSFKRLGDIALNTAKDMGRSFLDGFFKPFKDGLTGLGQEAGRWASGLIFGNQGGGGGGLLGGILGGGGGGLLGGLFGGGKEGGGLLSGIFGGGGGPMSEKIGGGLLGNLFGGGGAAGAGGLLGMLNPVGALLGGAGTAISAVQGVIAGGWKPGQQAANSITSLENAMGAEIARISADDSLTVTERSRRVKEVYDSFMAQMRELSQGPDKNIAKAAMGAISRQQKGGYVDALLKDWSGWRAREAEMARMDSSFVLDSGLADKGMLGGGSGNTINGDINISFVLPDGITPEGWLDWLYKNKAGIQTAITESVLAMQGAITAH
jgi:hypothetical protein